MKISNNVWDFSKKAAPVAVGVAAVTLSTASAADAFTCGTAFLDTAHRLMPALECNPAPPVRHPLAAACVLAGVGIGGAIGILSSSDSSEAGKWAGMACGAAIGGAVGATIATLL